MCFSSGPSAPSMIAATQQAPVLQAARLPTAILSSPSNPTGRAQVGASAIGTARPRSSTAILGASATSILGPAMAGATSPGSIEAMPIFKSLGG